MQLYFNPASPFVRKVLIVAHECEVFAQLELSPVAPLPTKPVPELSQVNPLGKVPTLVTEAGSLYDSRVVAEYLDSLASKRHVFPAAGPARWIALRQQAEADGIMDAAVSMRYEQVVRPKELQFQDWLQAQWLKVRSALDRLDAEAPRLDTDNLTIGVIAIACALGYLDLRFSDRNWRDGRAALASFHETFSRRASYQQTMPPAA